jgi:N-acetylneuraminate synthase
MATSIDLNGRAVGTDHPPYFIAEMSGNHNGDLSRALLLMDAAKAAGADAVKLQTYTADTLTIDHDSDEFQLKTGLWKGYSLYRLYQEAATPKEWHRELFARGKTLGLTVFSTPFDETAVDFLETLECPIYKIASFEIVDDALVEYVAACRKPLIVSTGMAELGEIAEAVTTARRAGATEMALLHCVSAYPAPAAEANLRTISHMAEAFDVVCGLSDHTQGIAVATAAVTVGASIIEKHFTLRRADGGVDSAFSLEPHEFSAMVQSCRDAWAAMGCVRYGSTTSEQSSLQFRRSLYVVSDIRCGERFTTENLRSIRPGFGLAPRHFKVILGRKARRELKRGAALDWSMVE